MGKTAWFSGVEVLGQYIMRDQVLEIFLDGQQSKTYTHFSA